MNYQFFFSIESSLLHWIQGTIPELWIRANKRFIFQDIEVSHGIIFNQFLQLHVVFSQQ